MIKNYDRVCALIDLDSIEYNINSICNKVNPDTALYAVTKADGYGHGAIPIARELEKVDKVRGYAVATAEEAMQLIRAGIKKDILVIGYTFPYAYEQMIENGVRLTVFREDTLMELNETAGRLGKKAFVHIKVDTGMGRIGILPFDDGYEFVKTAFSLENIEVEGIFTHFARADETDKANADEQYELFKSFVEGIEEDLGVTFKVKHCSNSAAIVDLPYMNMNTARAGIILYGLWPSDEVNRKNIDIKPVMKLISHITYVKNVAPGSAISYGGTYVAKTWRRIATIPVGYADGYPRALSNKAHVLIRGQKADIVGRVCMDQMMVDVTEIPGVSEGDEVIIIGSDKYNNSITMEELGEMSDHLNYELACDIGKRVPRLFVKNGEYICSKDYFEDVPVVDIPKDVQD